MRLFTCAAGLLLLKDGQTFHAWVEAIAEPGEDIELEVPYGAAVLDDPDGEVYHVIDSLAVKIISGK